MKSPGLRRRAARATVALVVGQGVVLFAAAGSLVIEVVRDQAVIDRGPYARVRHPMYAGFLVMGLATPLVLGSLRAELVVAPMIVLLVVRLLAEERFLVGRLEGYREYLARVRFRLVPGIW
jgi:protein-S-isoprenylcysteine O-methyltransferase Ste14